MILEQTNINFRIQQTNSDFLVKLQNIYSAENYCLRRIPGLINKIPENQLCLLLINHLPDISQRKIRIEKIFNYMNLKASGSVCLTFKNLIGKAGNIIYQLKLNEDDCAIRLISSFLEISIFRSYLYNSLDMQTDNFDIPLIKAAFKKCFIEEDNFFHSLIRIKKQFSQVTLANISPAQMA